MSTWGFVEIIGMETFAKLAQYQWKHHGLKLERPLLLHEEERPVSYPSLDEIDKEMRKAPVGMRRVV